jgi:hypothetical protein
MTNQFSHDAITGRLGNLLNGVADITGLVTDDCGSNTRIECLTCYSEQAFHLRRYFAHRNGASRICVEPLETDPAVHAEYVSFVKFILGRRNAVHDLAVDGGAERLRKVIQALERRSSPGMTPNKILREPIEISGGYPGPGMRFH